MTAIQLNLDAVIRGLPARQRLLRLSWIEQTFDLMEDAALALVETGRLRYAFDLSSAGARRAEVRVWRHSAESYARFGDRVLGADVVTAEIDAVIRDCLPPGDGPFLLSKLQRPWAVKSTHLHDLCVEGELRPVPGQLLGKTQSPLIDRLSAVQFLKRRRVL